MITPIVFSDEVSEDFEQAVRLSAAAGARGIEIRGRMFGRAVPDITAADVAKMKEILARYDCKVGVIGSPFGKCHYDKPEEVQRHHEIFRRMVELAHAFGTPIIRGFAFWNPLRGQPGASRPKLEEYLDKIVPLLRPAVNLAADNGLVLAFETEDSTLVGTCREVRTLLDALDAGPAAAVTWDVNNGQHLGEEPLPDGYALIKGHVRHLHIKPNPDKSLATVGTSRVTYEQILRTLQADGYDDCASIEHWGSPELMLKGVRELVALLNTINASGTFCANHG